MAGATVLHGWVNAKGSDRRKMWASAIQVVCNLCCVVVLQLLHEPVSF